MKKFLSAILILLGLISCNRDKTPDYVIPHDKMVDVLVDIHLMDGLLTIHNIRQELLKKDSLNYYDALLNKYNYTRADLDTSIYYYSMKIDEYDKIYEEILNRLSEMEAELKEQNAERDTLTVSIE